MFEAVIFDFGGVITESPFEAFNRLETAKAIPLGTIRRINAANADHNAWARFERAEIDFAAFNRLFTAEAQAIGVSLSGQEVIACLQGEVRPIMLEALKRISKHMKTGCITNNVRTVDTDYSPAAARYAQAMSLFSHVIESSKAGIRKPDPRIYRMMCEALAVEPPKCIFLDDLGVNLKPARNLGMTTIKVESPQTALDELEALLAITLR